MPVKTYTQEEVRQAILRFNRDLTTALTCGYSEQEARGDLERCIMTAKLNRRLGYGKIKEVKRDA